MKRSALVALTLLVAIVFAACGDDDGKKQTVRNDADIVVTEFDGETTEMPTRPIAVAADDEGVWVTSMAGGVVTKVDPKTGRKIGKPIATDDSPYAITVAFGKVWVAAFQNDKLFQIDPETRKVIKTTKVGNRPFGLTDGFGSMWVTSIRAETLSRVNPDSGEIEGEPIELTGPPHQVAAGFDHLWVTNTRDGVVDKVDPERGEVVDSYEVGELPSAVIAAGDSIWVANVGRDELVLDPRTKRNKIIRRGSSVWRIDPDTGRRIGAPIEVPIRPYAMAGDAENIWVVSIDGDTLLRIDTKTGRRDKLPIGIGNAPTDVALADGKVWVPLSRDDELAIYDPSAE